MSGGCSFLGHVIGSQIMDVCIRVQAIRPFAITEMSNLLDVYASTTQFCIMQEVLLAAAFLCGEFARYDIIDIVMVRNSHCDCGVFKIYFHTHSELKNPEQTLRAMIRYRTLKPHIEAVFIHNILKLFVNLMQTYELVERYDDILTLRGLIVEKLSEAVKSGDLEVQERASTTIVMLSIVKEAIEESKSCKLLF